MKYLEKEGRFEIIAVVKWELNLLAQWSSCSRSDILYAVSIQE